MSTDSSPIVRRAKVTYGRRVENAGAEILLADTSMVSNSSSADEPPSSDGVDASSFMEGLADEEEYPPCSLVPQDEVADAEEVEPKFEFAWKKQLAAMDDSDDDEGQEMVPVSVSHLPENKGKSMSFSKDDKDTPNSQNGYSPGRTGPAHAESSRRKVQADSSLTDLLDSPIPTRRSKPRSAILSDTEEEAGPSSPQTPAHSLHHLNTPQRYSSSTPPTSTETASRKEKAPAAKLPPPLFDNPDSNSDEDRPERRKRRSRRPQKGKEKRVKVWHAISSPPQFSNMHSM